MASTAERIRKLVSENIEVDGKALDLPDDLNVTLAELGVSSTDAVALTKLIAQEFDIQFKPEDCTELDSMNKLVDLIDSKAG